MSSFATYLLENRMDLFKILQIATPNMTVFKAVRIQRLRQRIK